MSHQLLQVPQPLASPISHRILAFVTVKGVLYTSGPVTYDVAAFTATREYRGLIVLHLLAWPPWMPNELRLAIGAHRASRANWRTGKER